MRRCDQSWLPSKREFPLLLEKTVDAETDHPVHDSLITVRVAQCDAEHAGAAGIAAGPQGGNGLRSGLATRCRTAAQIEMTHTRLSCIAADGHAPSYCTVIEALLTCRVL